MNQTRFSRWLALSLVAVTATTLTACTSGSSAKLGAKPLKLKPVFEATKALGRVDVTGEIRNGAKSGSITGAYNYPNAAISLSLPVLAPEGKPRAQYLARGKDAWIGRATYSGA